MPFSSQAACLTALLLGALVQARRTTVDSEGTTRSIDWPQVVETIREIDQTKDTDAFIVFESATDTELTEIARPPLEKVSMETFKEALRSCGPKNKICIGYYKVNYPMFIGSSTRKEKGVLAIAIDKVKIMVKMPVTRFVWAPLKQQLRDAGIAPSATFELSSKSKLDRFNVDSLWDEFASKATRVEDAEIAAFKQHGQEQIENAIRGGPIDTPVIDDGNTNEPVNTDPHNGGQPKPTQGSSGGVSVDPKMIEELVEAKMAKIEEEVESIVEQKAEEMARKAAQDEVGRAIRKLGTSVQSAYADVGKMWIDKART